MKHRYFFMVVLFMIFTAHPVSAELITGKWVGSFVVTDKESINVHYEVDRINGEAAASYEIAMFIHDDPFPFSDLELKGDQMTFTLNTGIKTKCKLEKQEDDTYEGECVNSNDQDDKKKIKLKMIPPQETRSTESGS